MVYLDEDEIYKAYQLATEEADQWRKDYPQYERLADNGLLDDLDENLPEVNDGSLAASLFKLAKRVIRQDLGGRAIVQDRDEDWITELANIEFQYILRHANSKATPKRKMKDAVRKAAIFGGQPIITLMVDRGNYCGADFLVPYAQDVKLEAGKDSDQDSDIIFWDVYYSKTQLRNMIAQAKEEIAEGDSTEIFDTEDNASSANPDNAGKQSSKSNPKPQTTANAGSDKPGDMSETVINNATPPSDEGDDYDEDTQAYNRWFVAQLERIIASEPEEQRGANEQARGEQADNGHVKSGYHFFIAFQRGVNAPFTMMHVATKKTVREWNNPDPTGDVPVHYLYCYQDFINPYGIGIVKLAGGTQNVLDYMRQADVLATQLGLRPPKQIIGDEDQVDEDSLVYAQDANWYVGTAKVERMELADGVYNQLPNRISMYKTSLQAMIPTGDTSISSSAGDPQMSKTPAGVNFQAANLSIDDEDFSENVDETWAAVGRSMINIQFANMEGEDWRKISDEEKADLIKAGMPEQYFEIGDDQKPTGKVQMLWDQIRAHFDFTVDATVGRFGTAQERLEAIKQATEMMTPQTSYYLAQAGWKFDLGEAFYASLHEINLPNLERILTKMTDEERQAAMQQPFPIIDPPQIRLTGQIPTNAMPAALAGGGVVLPPGTPLGQDNIDIGDILKDPNTTPAEKAQIKAEAGIQPDPAGVVAPMQDPNAPQQPQTDPTKVAELQLKAQDQAHSQELERQHLALEDKKVNVEAAKVALSSAPSPLPDARPVDPKAGKADQKAITSTQGAAMPTVDEAGGHIDTVMQQYNVDAPTAAAMLEADRQGYSPQEIVAAMQRNQPQPAGAK